MSKPNNNEMSFLDHLEELRWHIVRSFIVVVAMGILAFIFKSFVFDTVIMGPSRPDFFTNRLFCSLALCFDMPALCINQEQLAFQNISMSGQFTMHIWVAFVVGAVVAFPYVFWEFWRFVRPALYEKEIKHSRGAVFATSVLFSIGILFSYYLIAPLSVYFLGGYQVSPNVKNIINFGSYVSTIASIVLAGGVMFELPVFIYFLSKAGLVSVSFLKKYRRHAIVISFALAAVITPPDVISQIMVCLPLILLYEVGIAIAKKVELKRKKQEMA
jgi:sec-independent protein translocase protein TatC